MKQIPLPNILKHKLYTYEGYLQDFGTPPPYIPQMPQKFWVGNTNKSAETYFFLDVSNQAVAPTVKPYSLPDFIYNSVNIANQEWSVTTVGRNNSTIPAPLTEDAVEKFKNGIYVATWNHGIVEIWDKTPIPGEKPLPVEFSLAEKELIATTAADVKDIRAAMNRYFNQILQDLGEIEKALKEIIKNPDGTNRT